VLWFRPLRSGLGGRLVGIRGGRLGRNGEGWRGIRGELTAGTEASTRTFSSMREPLTAPELSAAAVTSAEVLVAVESMRFNMPVPAAEASMPTLQDEKSSP